MAFNLVDPTAPNFGDVPRTRTKYAVAWINASFNGGTAAAPEVVVSSDTPLQMAPVAALNWEATANGVRRRAGVLSGDFPLKLVVQFKMPEGDLGVGPRPKLIVTAAGQTKEGPSAANQVLKTQARISLILDCSRGMATVFDGSTRFVQAREALKVALALMADGDQAELILIKAVPEVRVAMDVLSRQDQAGVRKRILTELATLVATNELGNIEAAVNLASAQSTAKILFTDCTQEAGNVTNLPDDSTRYVLGLSLSSTASRNVFNDLGGGLGIANRVAGDTAVKVQKFSSQILLKAVLGDFVYDPEGALEPGQTANFDLTACELDHEMKAIVFTDANQEFEVKIHSGHANHVQREDYTEKEPLAYTDTSTRKIEPVPAKVDPVPPEVPVLLLATQRITPALILQTHGQFHISVKRKGMEERADREDRKKKALRFAVSLAVDSDLRLNAQLHATSLHVGATLLLSATLNEAGITVARRAAVHVELTYPDGGTSMHELEEGPVGRFSLQLESLRPGDYVAHFFAKGETLLGTPFLREEFCWLKLRRAGESRQDQA